MTPRQMNMQKYTIARMVELLTESELRRVNALLFKMTTQKGRQKANTAEPYMLVH